MHAHAAIPQLSGCTARGRHSACVAPPAHQVDKLRSALEDARRRLGAQSRGLQQQWRRGVTLGDTVRLLGDVSLVVDSPQRVQRLEDAKARACDLCWLFGMPCPPLGKRLPPWRACYRAERCANPLAAGTPAGEQALPTLLSSIA